MGETSESDRTSGLPGSLRQFGDSIVGLVQTRLDILSLEWAEERGALLRLILVTFAIVACLQLAIVVGLVFLLLAISEQHRLAVLGIAALVLLLAAAGGAAGIWLWLKRRPPVFHTTIEEFRKDREWIRGRS